MTDKCSYGLEVWLFYQGPTWKTIFHTIGDRFAKLVIDEPDEDAAKRQEPDQIPEVFRPDSGTGIKPPARNAASTSPTRGRGQQLPGDGQDTKVSL